MRVRSWWVLLLVMAGAGPVQAQVKLEWKLKEGDILFFETETVHKQELEFKGKSFKQTEKVQQLWSLTVKEKKAGATILEQKFEKIKTLTEGVATADAKLAEKMAGSIFTLTLNSAGKVTKFEGYNAFIKKLADGNADFEKSARSMLPEDVLKHGTLQFFHFLPPNPIKKDDTWKLEEKLPLGPLGSFKGTSTYRYEGQENQEEIISAQTALTYAPPAAVGGVFKISKGNLKAEDAKGRFVFDADKGRLVEAQKSMTLKGNLTMDFMGQQADMTLVMDTTHTLRVLDKKPAEK